VIGQITVGRADRPALGLQTHAKPVAHAGTPGSREICIDCPLRSHLVEVPPIF
jgi:hypothetical protein